MNFISWKCCTDKESGEKKSLGTLLHIDYWLLFVLFQNIEHSSLEVETYHAMDNMDISRAQPEEAHSCSEVRFRRIHLLHLYSCSSVSRYVTKNWSFSSRTNQIMQSVNALLLLTRAFFVSAENIQNHILFRLPCSAGSSSGAWGKV